MTRFLLTATVAALAIVSFAPVANALPQAKLTCRKAGGDGTPTTAPLQIAQPAGGGTHLEVKLADVLVSS